MNELDKTIGSRDDILVEMTKRKVVEKALKDALASADSANQAKSSFLSRMSHEIRTPLTAILGNAEILKKELEKRNKKTDSVDYDMASRIISNGEHLLQLINDILDFSKIEANKLKIENTFFNLQSLINNIEQMFLPLVKEKDLNFVVEINETLPIGIKSDEIRLKQVIINLLSNAIKFTSPRGLVKLIVEYDPQKECIVGKVADSGIGISDEKLEHLFTSFSQADESTTRLFGGT